MPEMEEKKEKKNKLDILKFSNTCISTEVSRTKNGVKTISYFNLCHPQESLARLISLNFLLQAIPIYITELALIKSTRICLSFRACLQLF